MQRAVAFACLLRHHAHQRLSAFVRARDGSRQRQLAGATVVGNSGCGGFDLQLLLERFGRAREPLHIDRHGQPDFGHEPVAQRRHLLRPRGQHKGHQPQIPRVHRHGLDIGGRTARRLHLQQRGQLAPAAVGHGDSLRRAQGARLHQTLHHGLRKRHRRCPLTQFRQPHGIKPRHGLGQVGRQLQQVDKLLVGNRLHRHAQRKTVVEGLQRLVVGHLVGGTDHADQRHRHPAAAVVELALVEQRQQRVENGRIGLEHLVEKRHLRRGQKAFGQTLVTIILQRAQRKRPEQLLRHRKARQEPLEIARAGKHPVQTPRQLALGSSRRANQQHMLAGQRSQQQHAHGGVALQQVTVEVGEAVVQSPGVHGAMVRGLHGLFPCTNPTSPRQTAGTTPGQKPNARTPGLTM